MTKRPLVAIVADTEKAYQQITSEPRRIFELASTYSEQVRVLLVAPQDVLLKHQRMYVLRGIKYTGNTRHTVTFNSPAVGDYFYFAENGHHITSATRTEDSTADSPVRLIMDLRHFAETNGIPVNITSQLALTCRFKQKTDNAIDVWEQTQGIHIDHIYHHQATSIEELTEILIAKNKEGIDTVLKPVNSSNALGIVIVKGGVSQKKLEERFKRKDIQQVFSRLAKEGRYSYCDFLTDTYLVDNRKVELRLHVVPYIRQSGEVDIQYAGAIVRIALDPYNPRYIENPHVSITKLIDKRERQPQARGYLLEQSSLNDGLFMVKLMTSAREVVRALYNATAVKEKPSCILFGLDYLVQGDGKPVLLEVNSRSQMFARHTDLTGILFDTYLGRHFQITAVPEIIYQAQQYQQRRLHR